MAPHTGIPLLYTSFSHLLIYADPSILRFLRIGIYLM